MNSNVHPEMLPEGPYAAEQAATIASAKFWLTIFGAIGAAGLLIARAAIKRFL